MRQIYFDHSATTALAPEVFQAMKPYLTAKFGNPSSIHAFGQETRTAIESARERLASTLGAEPKEIVFTSGGTESNNYALIGAATALQSRGNHIVTSRAEHHSVLHTCNYLEKQGYTISYVPVDEFGQVNPESVEGAITPKTILISIMHANNETGAINPIKKICSAAHERGILFHTDAVQSFGKLQLDVRETPVDLLSLSGHKIYGPKGIGALYIRQGVEIEPLLHGGGQERDRRAGTENVSGILGLAAAATLCMDNLVSEAGRLKNLTEYLYSGIIRNLEGVIVNGHPEKRVPGVINLNFQRVFTESLVLNLNLSGIAASNGSACSSGSMEPSHVLLSMGRSEEEARTAVRFSLGRENTKEDCDYVIEVLPEIVERLRSVAVRMEQ